ncbi:hypothetical protein MLD38_001986 [Melastoma candidum]|nr:hypothetical protein MLD38_001986 [Melastoma candidum]
MQALSLLGNPIMGNMGEEQLRKAVYGLLPKLAYLNKQPIKQQQRAGTESVAKATLGISNRGPNRRRTMKVGRSKPESLR